MSRTPFTLADHVPAWQSARRYAVPVSMVSVATARREAGDVDGACAAARVDQRVDVAAVRRARGAEVAHRLADDLRHLAPDLIRWHVPRHPDSGPGLIRPGQVIVLARYGGDALHVLTPSRAEDPQRLTLRFGPVDFRDPDVQADRWDLSRHLWDARATGGLRRAVGAGDRLPFHDRDGRLLAHDEPQRAAPDDPVALVEWTIRLLESGPEERAWVEAGFRVRTDAAERWDSGTGGLALLPVLRDAIAGGFAALGGGDVALLSTNARNHWGPPDPTVLEHAAGTFSVRRAKRETLPEGVVTVPSSWWRRSPDLELLRLGRITPGGLHPLVRDALFPGLPADYRPMTTPPDVTVRCGRTWHRIGWRDGRVEPQDHTPEEVRRERAMAALGAEVPGCFTIEPRWRTGRTGTLPKGLRAMRRHVLALTLHGDADGFARLLDRGVDPVGDCYGRGRGLLHLMAYLDRPDLVTRLVAAGADPHARDVRGRTPLSTVLRDGASAGVVRALLDAGAQADTADADGLTPLHLLRSADAATIVPWLRDAGADLEQPDTFGRPPLLAQLFDDAPAARLRALLGAGADPRDVTLIEVTYEKNRTDLDFLIAAHREARS